MDSYRDGSFMYSMLYIVVRHHLYNPETYYWLSYLIIIYLKINHLFVGLNGILRRFQQCFSYITAFHV